ncbi:MAG: DUF1854 domain-containing protein [Planctomycetota bacterium]|jgi:hypothetical protein|nr:DUF1854 domain-containing protein [Planctomycetota bacterium]
MDAAQNNADAVEPNQTEIRFLAPDMCRIHLGTHDALHVTVKNERIYGGVYAAYAFPVAHPDEYIALIHTAGEEEVEIGVIRNLGDFPEEDAGLVRQALARRYFVHTITQIRRVGWKHGFVNLVVETDKGPADILVPWRHDRAFDYGRRGKVLVDLENNRYLIEDLEKLPPRDRNEFQRYIYW